VKLHSFSSVAIERGGKRVLIGRNSKTHQQGNVDVIDTATGQVLTTVDANAREVRAMSFFPNGQRFVTGGQDGQVRIWDTETGKLLLSLKAGPPGIWDVKVSRDGRTLATADTRGSVRVWEAPQAPETPR
jgi:WD40 repeat protein